MKVLVPVSETRHSDKAVMTAVNMAGTGPVVVAAIGKLPAAQGQVESAFRQLRQHAEEVAAGIESIPVITKVEVAQHPLRSALSIAAQDGVERIVVTKDFDPMLDHLDDEDDLDPDVRELLERIEVTIV